MDNNGAASNSLIFNMHSLNDSVRNGYVGFYDNGVCRMRNPWEFVDRWGLLDKLYMPDGGDTGQREGMFWGLLGMMKKELQNKWLLRSKRHLGDYEEIMKKINPHPSVILRHSNPLYDASDWDRMSRDQFQPNIIAAGYWSKERINGLRRGHRRRAYLFTSNTRKNGASKSNHGTFVAGETRDYSWKLPDPTFFEIWANFIRASKQWWFYPFLLVYDLELLFGSIKWRYWPKHNIALNHTLSVLQCYDIMPTPWSYLAVKVMPVEKLASICGDHLNDFHPDQDMQFIELMIMDAYRSIKERR